MFGSSYQSVLNGVAGMMFGGSLPTWYPAPVEISGGSYLSEYESAPIGDAEIAILREGKASLHDAQDVGQRGGYGFAVLALRFQGMMAHAAMEPPPEGQYGYTTHYAITDEGRAELERARKRDLAKIGVYECDR